MTFATFVLVYTLWLKGAPEAKSFRTPDLPTYEDCLNAGYRMRLRFALMPIEKQEFKCIKEEET